MRNQIKQNCFRNILYPPDFEAFALKNFKSKP